jgi:hypothetical protein
MVCWFCPLRRASAVPLRATLGHYSFTLVEILETVSGGGHPVRPDCVHVEDFQMAAAMRWRTNTIHIASGSLGPGHRRGGQQQPAVLNRRTPVSHRLLPLRSSPEFGAGYFHSPHGTHAPFIRFSAA